MPNIRILTYSLILSISIPCLADEILTRELIPAGDIPFSRLQGASLASTPGYLIIGDLFGPGTRVWDIPRREVVNRYASADFLGNTIYGHAIREGHHIEIFTTSSSGSRLVSTDLETGERFESPIALSTGQRSLLGVANNRAAAISYVDFTGNDGIILVYDTRTGEELHVIRRSDLLSPGENGTIVSGIVSGNSLYALTWAVEMDPDIAAAPGNLHRVDLATGAVGFKTPVAVSRNDNQHPAGRGNTYNLAAGDGLIAVAGRDEVTLVDSLSGEVVSEISGLGRTVANEPVSGLSSVSRYVGGHFQRGHRRTHPPHSKFIVDLGFHFPPRYRARLR